MKKIVFSLATCFSMIMAGCGMMGNNGNGGNNELGNVLNGVLGVLGSESTLGSLADLVIGSVKLTQADLVGTWGYEAPGCAFTSENLLAKAGGAVAAGQVKEKLAPVYNSLGLNAENTNLTFANNGQFSGRIKGIPVGGTYTFDPSTSAVLLDMTLLKLTGYATRTTTGMSFTFESKKLLNFIQLLTSLTGNSTIKTVGDLSKQFEGVRVGFDMRRYQ